MPWFMRNQGQEPRVSVALHTMSGVTVTPLTAQSRAILVLATWVTSVAVGSWEDTDAAALGKLLPFTPLHPWKDALS